MDLLDRRVTAELVFLVRKGLDRFGIGVRQIRAKGRNLRANGDGNKPRATDQLKLRFGKRLDQLFIRHGRSRTVRTVLLEDLRHNLFRPPIGNARVEDFIIGTAVVGHRLIKRPAATTARRPTHVQRELAPRLVNRRRDAEDGKGDQQPDQQKDENRQPALGHDPQHSAEGDRTHDRAVFSRTGARSTAILAVCAVTSVSTIRSAPSVIHRALAATIGHLVRRAIVYRRRAACRPVVDGFVVRHSS